MNIYGLFRYFPTQLGTKIRSYLVSKMVKSCGKNLVVQPGVLIRYPENLILGDDINLNDNVYINAIGGLTIGDGCRIAPNVTIITESHNISRRDIPFFQQGYTYKSITIEADVWICAGAVITMGRKIGKGAVIGANAVVTTDIPEYQIWGGVPAKYIKDRL